tara:strand:- start:565 stop:1059 length:495 start_codon:yes stop_codon:yes gene_type:complete
MLGFIQTSKKITVEVKSKNKKQRKNMELNEKKIKKLTSNLSTPLSGLSFVFIAYALFTDGKVKEEEAMQALKNTMAFGKLWEYNTEEMKEAFKTAQTVLGECKMEEVEAIFVDILAKLHVQDGFENKQREWVVSAFEVMMDADGEKNERELYWIERIKEFWQLS